MFNAFDILHLATVGDRVQKAVKSATQTLLTDWREKAPGKSDDDILRDKLVECGWKYSRQKGCWMHSKVESLQAPRDLRSLAEMIATTLLHEVQNEEQ